MSGGCGCGGARKNPGGGCGCRGARKNPGGMVPPQSAAFLAKLRSWHAGQGDPIYAVASSWFAGNSVHVDLVERASVSIAKARRQVRESKSPRPGSIAELDRIEERLDMLVKKYGARSNPMAAKKTKSRASKGKSKAGARKKTAGKKPARSAKQIAATKRMQAGARAKRGGKKTAARKNPVRTKAGRVLKASGSKTLASKLLRARKKMKAVGLEGPEAVKTGKRGRMTYESAQQILKRPARSNPRPIDIDDYLEESFG